MADDRQDGISADIQADQQAAETLQDLPAKQLDDVAQNVRGGAGLSEGGTAGILQQRRSPRVVNSLLETMQEDEVGL
jgi:hypothetical protein